MLTAVFLGSALIIALEPILATAGLLGMVWRLCTWPVAQRGGWRDIDREISPTAMDEINNLAKQSPLAARILETHLCSHGVVTERRFEALRRLLLAVEQERMARATTGECYTSESPLPATELKPMLP